jgi:hypothetical protein
MATITLEYDSRNKTARQVIDGLALSGIFSLKSDKKSRKEIAKEKHIAQFKEAVRQTLDIAADIRKNGTSGYKTLEELLAED